MWEKIREPSNVIKVQSHVMLVFTQYENDTINCEKKNKRTIKCNKSIFTCDVSTVQGEDSTFKYEKK